MRIGARSRAELEQSHEHLLAVFEARRFQQSLLFRRVKRQRNTEKVH